MEPAKELEFSVVIIENVDDSFRVRETWELCISPLWKDEHMNLLKASYVV